jgi:hypothetical protein
LSPHGIGDSGETPGEDGAVQNTIAKKHDDGRQTRWVEQSRESSYCNAPWPPPQTEPFRS